ncbi:MAG: hypothetical protein AAF623_13765 [Planctomycetota bacterium]
MFPAFNKGLLLPIKLFRRRENHDERYHPCFSRKETNPEKPQEASQDNSNFEQAPQSELDGLSISQSGTWNPNFWLDNHANPQANHLSNPIETDGVEPDDAE